ncbi:putative dihydrofolate reductase [Ralstonia phage RSF1]|uniref:dihydrofolate reductase n=1 Tax=Ralstonia phage RSF1 TaxID=1689679 RepID=A0A0K2QQK4_9CAUD|nr:dihydrofolate reductase [Ralstonia phage RSF1]BAS04869.1 putative dihydrofolate reductase [Ralstonia phage RSF1]
MKIILIAAEAANKVIGNDGKMPWHIPEDLQGFKNTTMGSAIIMGRKTWDSFGGRPLPGRKNIIVSRQLDAGWTAPEGAFRVHSFKSAIKSLIAAGYDHCFVIGGEQLYRAAMPWASMIMLTKLYKSYEGDARFPDISPLEWRMTASAQFFEASQPYSVQTYYPISERDVVKWVDLIKD